LLHDNSAKNNKNSHRQPITEAQKLLMELNFSFFKWKLESGFDCPQLLKGFQKIIAD
jgi:hypothetical protein